LRHLDPAGQGRSIEIGIKAGGRAMKIIAKGWIAGGFPSILMRHESKKCLIKIGWGAIHGKWSDG
jgi:hypothetical protein